MNPELLFSVIIPTYHRNDLLAKCLNCLAPGVQTLPANQYEIIVTDDGSQTTAEEMIRERYPWAKWVAGPRKGPAANRNNGGKYAQGKWLAFIDDDCLADPQWLNAYAEAIVSQPSYSVFEGRVYVDRPRRSLAETSPIFESGGLLPSGNFIIKKQLYDSLGGFDERFHTAMEDVELRLRLIKGGHKFIFIRSASVCHPWRMVTLEGDGWKRYKGYIDSFLMYISIHPEEKAYFNSMYYLRATLAPLIKETLPGIIKYKGSGLGVALRQHILSLQLAVLLLFRR